MNIFDELPIDDLILPSPYNDDYNFDPCANYDNHCAPVNNPDFHDTLISKIFDTVVVSADNLHNADDNLSMEREIFNSGPSLFPEMQATFEIPPPIIVGESTEVERLSEYFIPLKVTLRLKQVLKVLAGASEPLSAKQLCCLLVREEKDFNWKCNLPAVLREYLKAYEHYTNHNNGSVRKSLIEVEKQGRTLHYSSDISAEKISLLKVNWTKAASALDILGKVVGPSECKYALLEGYAQQTQALLLELFHSIGNIPLSSFEIKTIFRLLDPSWRKLKWMKWESNCQLRSSTTFNVLEGIVKVGQIEKNENIFASFEIESSDGSSVRKTKYHYIKALPVTYNFILPSLFEDNPEVVALINGQSRVAVDYSAMDLDDISLDESDDESWDLDEDEELTTIDGRQTVRVKSKNCKNFFTFNDGVVAKKPMREALIFEQDTDSWKTLQLFNKTNNHRAAFHMHRCYDSQQQTERVFYVTTRMINPEEKIDVYVPTKRSSSDSGQAAKRVKQ